MNIQAEKSALIERFMQINDETLIKAIKEMLDCAQKDDDNLLDDNLKIKLSNRALISERNILNKEVLSFDEMKYKTAQLFK